MEKYKSMITCYPEIIRLVPLQRIATYFAITFIAFSKIRSSEVKSGFTFETIGLIANDFQNRKIFSGLF